MSSVCSASMSTTNITLMYSSLTHSVTTMSSVIPLYNDNIYKLDIVCRKRAVSNSRPACREAFLNFMALGLLFLLATVRLCYSAYMPRQFRSPYVRHTRIPIQGHIKTAEPVIAILSLSDRPIILIFRHQGLMRPKSDCYTPKRGAEYKRVTIVD